jgi:release factor glutamine methyltransferase
MNIASALEQAAEVLAEAGVADARREAASLLAFAINKDRTFLIAHPEQDLSAATLAAYKSFINRRSQHEPYQYIVGRQEFFGLDFEVTSDVLVPRPETEILVEKAIDILKDLPDPSFCEIGVGSGCISVSILHSVNVATATAVDVSDRAIAIARHNAEQNGVANRLSLQMADIFSEVAGRFDLVVSNPPYVPTRQIETLQAEVRRFEPLTALEGGADGLDIIKRIVKQSPGHLISHGVLLMEIGFDQSERVRQLFDGSVWETPEFIDDLQGIPRIVAAKLLK